MRRETRKKNNGDCDCEEHRHGGTEGVRTETDALLLLPPRFAHAMESAYWGKDKGKGTRDWDGKGMRGVQRGKHEELAKDDGKARLIKAADSGQMAYDKRK